MCCLVPRLINHTESCTRYSSTAATSLTSTCTGQDNLRVFFSGLYATSSFEKWGVVTNHNQRTIAYRQDTERFPAILRKQARKGGQGDGHRKREGKERSEYSQDIGIPVNAAYVHSTNPRDSHITAQPLRHLIPIDTHNLVPLSSVTSHITHTRTCISTSFLLTYNKVSLCPLSYAIPPDIPTFHRSELNLADR